MVFAQIKMSEALYRAVKMVVPLLALLLVVGIIVYAIYSFVGNSIQSAEYRKHQKEEEALRSIEVLKDTTKDIGNSDEIQVFNFQLEEGGKYRIYNLLIEYSFYDPENDRIMVSVYCNERPYDVWEFQPLGEDDSISEPAFECPDWDGKKIYSVLIVPKKFVKVYLDNTGSGTREIVIEHYILDFQVKVQVIKTVS